MVNKGDLRLVIWNLKSNDHVLLIGINISALFKETAGDLSFVAESCLMLKSPLSCVHSVYPRCRTGIINNSGRIFACISSKRYSVMRWRHEPFRHFRGPFFVFPVFPSLLVGLSHNRRSHLRFVMRSSQSADSVAQMCFACVYAHILNRISVCPNSSLCRG